MKVFRLVNAELRKIFLRPTIFIMIAVLVLGAFISLLAFNPDNKSQSSAIEVEGTTISAIYNNFTQSSSSSKFTTKFDLDNKLEQSKENLLNFTTKDDVLTNLTAIAGKGQKAQSDYNNLQIALENAARPTTLAPETYYRQANTCLATFKTSLNETIIAFANFSQSNKYYLTKDEYDHISNTLSKIDNVVVAHTTLQNQKVYETILSTLRKNNFNDLMTDFIANVKPINLEIEKYNDIIKNYYDTSKAVLGSAEEPESLMGKIYTYYVENASEGKQEKRDEIALLISDYKAYINMTCENLRCALELEISNDITDKQMQTYINYSNFNKLMSSSTLSKNAYMIENGINPRTTLETMNFGVNSGDETNAWDFIAFSMNISSLIIIVFCVLICSKSIAGEQTGGTMKMLAIRPYSRNKILGGKLLSTMFFSMIFVLFSFIVSFAIGWAFYGLPGQMMIGVFNGTNVIYTHPIVFCLFLTLSLFLKIFIYVSIATMISVTFRSYTGSSMVSFAIVILTLILNGVLGGKHFFKYFPMANFDIYKYFTTSQTAMGFKAIFSSPLIIDTSFLFTFLYALGMILVFNLISFICFNKKDIA